MRGRGTRTPTTTRGTNHITPSRKAQRSGAVRGVSAARQAPQSVLREKDLLRNNEALNLRGALVDLEELGVAHQLLDRILLDVAVPAEDLHCVGRHLHRHVGGEALG